MRFIFLSDKFKEDFTGGAEMALHAVIEQCPCEAIKVKSMELTSKFIDEHKDDYWIIGNFAEVKRFLIKKIADELKYTVIEFDFKFCPARNISYWKYKTGQDFKEPIQEVVDLLQKAQKVFFMSKRQMDITKQFVPSKNYEVLSSMFCREEIENIESLMKEPEVKREGYLIIGTESWVKGFRETMVWAKSKGYDFKVVYSVKHKDLLREFKNAFAYVYLPVGEDTCPRAVIEARLLGCKLIINSNVLHHDEAWFCLENPFDVLEYLKTRVSYFWSKTNAEITCPMGVAG